MIERIQKPWQQRGPQGVHVAAEGVGQKDHVRRGPTRSRIGNERLTLSLVETQTCQDAPDLGKTVIGGIEGMRSHCAPGRCGRNAIDPEKPGHFFHQIHLALEIHAPRRHAPNGGRRSAATALPHFFEAEPGEELSLSFGGNLYT